MLVSLLNTIENVVAKVEDEQFILLLQCFDIRLLQIASTMRKGLLYPDYLTQLMH